MCLAWKSQSLGQVARDGQFRPQGQPQRQLVRFEKARQDAAVAEHRAVEPAAGGVEMDVTQVVGVELHVAVFGMERGVQVGGGEEQLLPASQHDGRAPDGDLAGARRREAKRGGLELGHRQGHLVAVDQFELQRGVDELAREHLTVDQSHLDVGVARRRCRDAENLLGGQVQLAVERLDDEIRVLDGPEQFVAVAQDGQVVLLVTLKLQTAEGQRDASHVDQDAPQPGRDLLDLAVRAELLDELLGRTVRPPLGLEEAQRHRPLGGNLERHVIVDAVVVLAVLEPGLVGRLGALGRPDVRHARARRAAGGVGRHAAPILVGDAGLPGGGVDVPRRAAHVRVVP